MSDLPPPTWMDEIRARLDLERAPRDPGLTEVGSAAPRPAAVLIPLFVRDRELWTLFTKRTEQVERHKGQVSFPGGGKEPEDESLWHTAIRETEEEIGVPSTAVRHLGTLAPFLTVSDYEVTPFVGAIPYPVAFRLDEREVESVIQVPMSFLLDPKVVESREFTWRGKTRETVLFHYQGTTIWGVTAHILAELLGILRAG